MSRLSLTRLADHAELPIPVPRWSQVLADTEDENALVVHLIR
jgi:hypothetical protein